MRVVISGTRLSAFHFSSCRPLATRSCYSRPCTLFLHNDLRGTPLASCSVLCSGLYRTALWVRRTLSVLYPWHTLFFSRIQSSSDSAENAGGIRLAVTSGRALAVQTGLLGGRLSAETVYRRLQAVTLAGGHQLAPCDGNCTNTHLERENAKFHNHYKHHDSSCRHLPWYHNVISWFLGCRAVNSLSSLAFHARAFFLLCNAQAWFSLNSQWNLIGLLQLLTTGY